MKCIAIDDSANALELIKIHISKTPFLILKGLFQSAPKSLDIIHEGNIDLIFIDIQMPDITGLEFIKGLAVKPLVVLTTAYSEFALKGYEVNAIDYLLKPISYEKFLNAANKAYQHYTLLSGNKSVQKIDKEFKFVVFKSGNTLHNINIKEILFLESKGNYIVLYFANGTALTTLMTMEKALEKLKKGNFLRCHRSFIIALDHISTLSTDELTIGSHVVPIGKNYRQIVKSSLIS